MTDDEYAQWIEFHGKLFWMNTPEDMQLFVAWRLSLSGFSLFELRSASRWIAEEHGAKFRTEHLTLLRRRLAEQREQVRRRAEQNADPNSGSTVCATCMGTGTVIVPDWRYVREGEWKFVGHSKPTTAVLCGCHRGESMALRMDDYLREKKSGFAPRLGSYAQRVPDWRELLSEEAARRDGERRSADLAARLDRARPIDPSKIAEQLAAASQLPTVPTPKAIAPPPDGPRLHQPMEVA